MARSVNSQRIDTANNDNVHTDNMIAKADKQKFTAHYLLALIMGLNYITTTDSQSQKQATRQKY